MTDVEPNIDDMNEDIFVKDKIEDDDDNSKDNKHEQEEEQTDNDDTQERESPTPSNNSIHSDDEPPENPPSLDDPYPNTNLFIFPPQKIHVCPKCKDVLREPVEIEACGHHVCYQCFVEISNLTKRCPIDQADLKGHPKVDNDFKREILELDVRCKNNEQGCKWEGSVQEYSDHVQYCDYNLMDCVCGATFPKRFKQRHRDKECGKEIVQCEHCSTDIFREDRKGHLNECPKRPLPCPNKCDKDLEFPRDEIDKHLEMECPRTKVTCRFEDIGCSHKASREKMIKHYIKEVTGHLDMLHERESKHDELVNKILVKLREHETMIAKEDERIADIEKINNTQVIWKIDDYSSKLSQAKSGNTETLFHPPFTTSKHGYRLSASVCLDGDGKGKGSHMSVFLCIHKGDYDVFLQWPFDFRVTFTLLDQNEHLNERQHIKYSIKPNPSPQNERFLGRPTMDKNASFGMQLFAKHDQIKTRNYIKDNAILLKLSVDCAGTDAVYLA